MSTRLHVEPLDVAWTPAEAVLALRGDDRPFALVGAWAGGGAVLGSEPVRVASADVDPFALLDALPEVDGGDDGAAGAVGGGWFGYLGFALGRRVERLPPPPPARVGLPPFALAYYDHVLRRDAEGRWFFEALLTDERAAAIAARRDALLARVGAPRPFRAGPFAPAAPGAAGLREAVRECVERIHAGELFQANLTMRIEGPFAGDPLDAFAAALALAPAHGALLTGPWGATIGLSPELFLRRRGREVLSRPIKGTIPREGDGLDARDVLVGSAKDRAENVMIVDLMRNDLGRVCVYGSVTAGVEPVAEPHPGVWHLVSDVRGTLREGVGDAELLRATFPPGSVTGAPKVQALRVISELEGSERHVYTGAVGFASPVAGLELNVAIRTFEVRDGVAWLGAGGGIVADSDPDAEVAEALGKARPLVSALGAELRPGPLLGGRLPAARALEGWLERPDPGLGVIETVAVRGGRAVDVLSHLARLSASVASVYGFALPEDLLGRVRRAAASCSSDGRLRVDAVPGIEGMRFEVAVHPSAAPGVPAPAPPSAPLSAPSVELSALSAPNSTLDVARVRIVALLLPGGLGAHKWRDRRLVEALEARHGAVPVFVDADGAVLEAAMANVWVLEGDALVTPPADGRILPGCTRARALALPGAREEPLDLDRLDAADAILLTSSIAILRVVDTGRPLPPADRLRALRQLLAADRQIGEDRVTR